MGKDDVKSVGSYRSAEVPVTTKPVVADANNNVVSVEEALARILNDLEELKAGLLR